ncbi:hypothetical protein JOS77_10485 [Chromobacterium haemolyticum]|nr:hypothetical protein JOS77_10485 [Chromobacterium haemolyticum]
MLAAFTSASALLIVLSQLGPLLGVQAGGASLPQLLAGLWKAVDGLNPLALLFGAAALAMLLLARWLGEPLLRRCGLGGPARQLWLRLAPLLAVLLGMALVAGLGLRSALPVVGEISPGLPAPTWPGLSLDQWSQLALPAFFIALINYVQSLAVAQALAQRRGDEVWIRTGSCWRWVCAISAPGCPAVFRSLADSRVPWSTRRPAPRLNWPRWWPPWASCSWPASPPARWPCCRWRCWRR